MCLALLSGCAEKNFVPGSPMAKLFGYNRTYEQIAADDCEKQFEFDRGSENFKKCVFELSISRRQSDSKYMATMSNLANLSNQQRNSLSSQSNTNTLPSNNLRTFVINGKVINCSTVGNNTTCY